MPRTMTMQETQQAIDRDRRQIAKWGQQIAAKQQQLKADANLAEMYSRKARTHGGDSSLLGFVVVLCAPFRMTVSSAVHIEQSKKLCLTGGGLGVTGGNDVEEALLLQTAQKADIPLAAHKQISGLTLTLLDIMCAV